MSAPTDPPTARHDHWIGGQPVAPTSGRYLETLNPATGYAGDEVAAGTTEDVDIAVAAARNAQPTWKARSAGERSAVVHAIADVVEANAPELMDLEGDCTGKTPAQLRMEIDMSVSYLRYYAGIIRSHHGHTIDHGSGHHTYTRFVPYGVVGIITPWNLPLNQACRAIAPAIAVGNTIIAKPSELTSISTLHLAMLASEAGLPPGVLNVVTGTGPDAGTPLAAHPHVRRLAFTGSVATGQHLARLAAGRLIPLTLELGGKSPLIVFADADLDRAARAAITATVMNAGQVCSATTRLLVEAPVHDDLLKRVVDGLEQLTPGVDYGPMITRAQHTKVLEHLATASDEGLTPIAGGQPVSEGVPVGSLYIQPTVYRNVPSTARIAREEIFGPVMVTMTFTGEDEAIAMANDTDYGLVGAVWSGDLARGVRVAERIEAGQVAINGGALSIETPFGGFKGSGYGREKGVEALHEYSQVQTISIALD